MEILKNHLKKNCDSNLPGILSLGVKEAYRFLDDLIKKEKILQREEMKQTWGHLRHGLIDVAIKQVLQSSNVQHEIADKTTSRYKNGHTYLMIEVKGAVITPAKVYKSGQVPKKAVFRDKGSILNKQFNLFEDQASINSEYDENKLPFLLLTYGGLNHKLEFVNLGLPETGVKKWIDYVEITNAPVLLSNKDEISSNLQLTFTTEAEKILRGVNNAEEEGTI